MYTSSFASHNPTVKSSNFRRQFHNAAFCGLLIKALQAVKETPDDCEKTFFNTTNFHRFHVQRFELLSPHIIDQIDSDSIIKALRIHLVNQNPSLSTFHEQNKTDAEKIENEVNIVFTETKFQKSSEIEISPNHKFLAPHGYFSNPELFGHKPVTYYFSLIFDADVEFSAKDTMLQVNYASSDYLFSYSANSPRKDRSAVMLEFNNDPISGYPVPHKD